jgi:pimeloyl-ACP methyl ester carboxylesterase
VDVGGQRLYYYAAGTRGDGVPVILLHGFPTSSRLWHAVVRDFPLGHRLVVCDLPGYGRSESSAAEPRCDALASAILALLDDLRVDRACIVGHGLGGGIAQAITVRAPSRVSHLALIDSAAFGAAPRRMARFARRLLPFATWLPSGLLAGLVQGSVRAGFADPERSRLTLDTCLHPFTTPHGRDALVRHLRAFASCDTSTLSAQCAERCIALGIPVAILWGANDPFYPVGLAAQLHAALPHATLEIVPGAKHFLPEDAPDRVVAMIGRLLDS